MQNTNQSKKVRVTVKVLPSVLDKNEGLPQYLTMLVEPVSTRTPADLISDIVPPPIFRVRV